MIVDVESEEGELGDHHNSQMIGQLISECDSTDIDMTCVIFSDSSQLSSGEDTTAV